MDRRPLAAALLLALGAGPASAAQDPARAPAVAPMAPAAPRVTEIELRVDPGEDRPQLAALVALSPGEPLSASALRRTVQRLFQTGKFRNVLVRTAAVAAPPGAGGAWVRVVVEGLPVRLLERVELRVDGPPALDPAPLRAAARLTASEPLEEADLAAAAARVRALLARRGYRAAEVETRASGERFVTAELRVRPGEPLRVAAVRLAGDPGPGAAAAGLKTAPGAILDEDALEADVRLLRARLHAAGHRRARVGVPAVAVSPAGANVTIPVEAGPRLAFVFRGNTQVSAATLERELGFERDDAVDAPAIDAAAGRIRTWYRARGYASAQVETEEARSGRDLTVTFRVDEGRRYRLGRVRFEGAGFRDEAWLSARLAGILDADAPEEGRPAEADDARALLLSVPGARPPPTPPEPLPPHEVWDEAAWDRAFEAIVEGYRAEGFLEAVYLGAAVELDARRRVADVTVRLREGPRTSVESISFEGNAAVSLAELAREARLAPGDPLLYERVEGTRAALLRLYLSRGHPYARVEVREDVDRARRVVAIRYVVSEGPRVRIGRIVVTGNRRTREDLVRSALDVREGDVYDPEAIARSQASLLRLGVFRSVGLRLQDPEVPQPTKDLAVEVAERPWASLAQGVGYSLANGPRATLEYAQPNVTGRALELSARARVNYPVETPWTPRVDLEGKSFGDRLEGRGDLGLRSPSLTFLPFPAGGRADVIGEILHRKAYELRRVAGIAGIDVGLTSRAAFSLQYELEVDELRKSATVGVLTLADRERLRFDEGWTTLQALRPSITLDHRDNSAHPHRGWFGAASLEYLHSLGADDRGALFGILPASDIHTNLLKLQGTFSGYLPIGAGSVIALSLRGGRVFPLDPDSRTIVPRRFFLGGATSMRGYAEEEMVPQDVRDVLAREARHCATSVSKVGCTERGDRIADGERPVSEGAEAFLLAKAELRLKVRGSLEAGFFVDLGNLWLDPRAYELLDLRANVGVGLRFVTPIGPAALDLGFNVEPDGTLNERAFAPHFTIGLF